MQDRIVFGETDKGPCKECERDQARGTVSDDNPDLQNVCSEHGEICNDCFEPMGYDEATGWYYHRSPDAEDCFLIHELNRPDSDD